MKRVVWIILGIMLLASGVAAFAFRDSLTAMMDQATPGTLDEDGQPSTDDGLDSSGESSIWALGRLEPTGGVITISAAPGDQLIELFVKEGESVGPATVLGRLQSSEVRDDQVEQLTIELAEASKRLEAERAAAKSNVASAKLAEEQAGAVAERELAALKAKAEALQLAVAQAEKELDRLTQLDAEAPDLVSDQQLDQARLALHRAQADLEAAQISVTSAEVTSDYRIRLAAQQREAAELAAEQVESASPIASLEKQLQAAKQQAERAQLRSPIQGTVLKIFTRPGETISQRPILQVADLTEMVCIAEVSHDQVHHISTGMEARIRSRAFATDEVPEYLQGTVIHLSLVAATPELREIDPFAAADRHVMEVRIQLDEASSRIAARFVHLQVDVEFVNRSPPEEP